MTESDRAPNSACRISSPVHLGFDKDSYKKPKDKKDKTGFGKKILRKLKRVNMPGYFDKIRSDV